MAGVCQGAWAADACVASASAPVDPGLADCTMGATVVADIAASALTPLLALTAAESRASFEERVGWTGHTRVCTVAGKGGQVCKLCVLSAAGVHGEPEAPHS